MDFKKCTSHAIEYDLAIRKQTIVNKEKIQRGFVLNQRGYAHSETTVYNSIYTNYLKQIDPRRKAGCGSPQPGEREV